MIGQTLSHYRITEKLGSGGMGEVYVAEDTKLSRKVALKVLPPEMAENTERRARFEREAKAVAALDHPNIVTIYSVEEAEGVHFYTMQLVKGKTLTELIPKKGMPLNKFFEIAIPLADAVSAAHEQGIIHRDLKPDNLMVSDEGRLKILDFGLAKLKPGFFEEGASELRTQSATAEGRILGTVAYMSPEQAEGKTVDNRSDIFSIGIILYEMATGERPFKGDTAASLLSSILRDTPRSVTEVNHSLPRDLGKIIRRCLVKDTEHRYQTTKDVRNELEELKQEVDSGEVLEGVPGPRPIRKWPILAAAATLVLIAGAIGYLLHPFDVTDEPTSATIAGTLTQVTSQPGQEIYPSLSPDGEFVVYASNASGNWDIIFQRVGGETALNLTENSVVDDVQPSFSPDGKQVAFRSERNGGGIFLMGATGESVRRLSDIGFNPAWSPDGSEIAFATESVNGAADRDVTSQLWAVDVASGEKRLITERDAVQPSWSPNGSRIAYWSIEGAEGRRTTKRDIWTIPAKGGEPVPITQDAYVDWNPVWSRDGSHLYFSSDRGGSMNLWRVRIEESSGKVIGQYEAVTTGASASRQHLSVSSEGEQIAYVERVLSRNLWKTRFDPATGNVQGKPIPITRGSRQVGDAHISPNGDWLACRSFGKQEDIFIVRTDGTGLRQLTNDLHRDRRPQWSPDGERIAFYSNRSGSHEIWTINHDGSGLQKLSETPGVSVWRPIWSPDGLSMAYYKPSEHTSYLFDPNTSWEMQTPQALPPFSDAQESFMSFSWSPDGSIAGVIESAGSFAGVTVYSLESKQYKKLTEFGSRPVWLADNRRLLFDDHGALFMVDSISGGIHEVLSTAPDIVRYASISPDNRWIYFSRIATEADIWMLTLNEERE